MKHQTQRVTQKAPTKAKRKEEKKNPDSESKQEHHRERKISLKQQAIGGYLRSEMLVLRGIPVVVGADRGGLGAVPLLDVVAVLVDGGGGVVGGAAALGAGGALGVATARRRRMGGVVKEAGLDVAVHAGRLLLVPLPDGVAVLVGARGALLVAVAQVAAVDAVAVGVRRLLGRAALRAAALGRRPAAVAGAGGAGALGRRRLVHRLLRRGGVGAGKRLADGLVAENVAGSLATGRRRNVSSARRTMCGGWETYFQTSISSEGFGGFWKGGSLIVCK